jgi:hypothetical protein
MPDIYILPLIGIGGVLLLIGLIWLLVVAIRTGFFRKAIFPVFLIVLGVAVAVAGPVYNRLYPPPIDTKVKVEVKETDAGESVRELTGTGANIDELKARLAESKNYAIIQIADKGFTDDDLAILDGMDKLTFIDLNDNPVTDATLERLVKLPKLTKLFAARTKFTADAVKKLVLENPDCKLTEIDFRGLTPPVPGKALREWQAKDPKNRKFN